jgi:hypothetical protein
VNSSLDTIPPEALADQAVKFAAASAACFVFLLLFLISSMLHAPWTYSTYIHGVARPLVFVGAPVLALSAIRRSSRALTLETSQRGKALIAAWLGATIIAVTFVLFALIELFSIFRHVVSYWATHSGWTF